MRRFAKLLMGLAAAMSLSSTSGLQGQGPAPNAASSPSDGAPPAAAALATNGGTARPDPRDMEAWLDGFMPYALAQGKIAGAVVVVVNRDGPILQKGYGFSDAASRKPVAPDATLFRPGSVSKLLTWTAVMQQVEAGRIDLDRDVNAYLDFRIPPFDGKPVTMRHIMTHTAGFEESIRHLITSDAKAVKPLRALMPEALPERVFAPGTTPAYSNYATALAGYVVERVSGMTFDDYVDRRIFAPLGMTRSTFRQPLPQRLEPFMSKGYALAGEKPKPFEIVVPFPAGSLSASGADMGRFMIAHLNAGQGLLRPETARMMHDYRAPRLGPLNTMALGFYEQQINGRRAIAHGGDTSWFHSDLWLFPEDGLGLYISMNSDGKEGASLAIRAALFRQFADRYLPAPEREGRVEMATARQHAQMLAGNYVSSRGSFTNFISLLGLLSQAQVSVTEDGGISFPALDVLSAAPREWVEIAPFVWRDLNSGERLAAEIKDGRVARLSLDTVSPFMVFTPAPFAQNTAWLLPATLAALAIAFLTAFAWPIRAVVRRRFGATLALEGRQRLAYRLTRVFSWVVIAVVIGWAGLISAFSADIGSLGGPTDWLIILLRIVSPIAAVGLLFVSVWQFWLVWRAKAAWWARLVALLLVFAGLVLTWVVLSYRLYGFGMVY